MIQSHSRTIAYKGRPAQLAVIRNNGSCWGRLTFTAEGDTALTQLDVATRKDWYDYDDEDALDAFERASRNPKCVDDAQGWLE